MTEALSLFKKNLQEQAQLSKVYPERGREKIYRNVREN
jgi:hypothetical protein